jgi:hypothetical protein
LIGGNCEAIISLEVNPHTNSPVVDVISLDLGNKKQGQEGKHFYKSYQRARTVAK